MATPEFERGGVLNFLLDLPVRAMFAVFGNLPYRISVNLAAGFSTRILAPLFMNARARANLKLVWPDLPEADVKRLCDEVAGNATRVLVELFHPKGFIKQARLAGFEGPGKDALLAALAGNTPVILVSGHIGNFHTIRVQLGDLGYTTAAIYRPMNNAFTNARYVDTMSAIAGPNFPRGMKGTKSLLGQLRKKRAIALLNDQAAGEGEILTFMGHPALTMTSAAEMALKHNALLVPYYCIRQSDGIAMTTIVEDAIVHSDKIAMTQALNDSLEARVKAEPGQWFWLHNRWKTPEDYAAI